ncbi:MAG TPA: hypothetical protein VFL91_07810 [Thermomicrobiales bacterium]|nr:hypothetical protein [Thermomicrobiales bacterium]
MSQQQASADQSANAADTGQTMERAEAMVDQFGERVGQFVSLAGLRILQAAARVREEAEDIWAEAQHMRQNGRG